MSERTLQDIETELDETQAAYVEEDDELLQMKLERRFSLLLKEATDLDGVDRIAAGITITNWVRENE